MDDAELIARLRNVDGWFFEDPCDHIVYVSDDPLEAADRIETLTAENERLREAGAKLNNHACHDDDCQIVTHGVWSDPIPCTCGYEDAWKAWSAALGDTQ